MSAAMTRPRRQRRKAAWLALLLLLLSVTLLLLGVGVGSTGFDSVLKVGDDPVAQQIVWDKKKITWLNELYDSLVAELKPFKRNS